MKTIQVITFLILSALACQAQTTPPTIPSAKGVWKVVLKEPRELVKKLRIYPKGKNWKAQLGTKNIPVKYRHGKFTIRWKKAKFDGEFARDAQNPQQKIIKGFWRQYGYVAPVELHPKNSGWEGVREVQLKRLTFYLVIRPKKGGNFKGFIHNPERNQGIFIRIREIVQKQRQVLIYGRDTTKPMFKGMLAKDGKTLHVKFRVHGMTGKVLHKVDTKKDILVRPRVGQKTYAYQTPPQLHDGWQTASLEKQGADMGKIKALMEKILTQKYIYLHSILIMQNNKLLLEEYFYGHHRDQYHDTRSAGKSLASTMVGLALDQGLLSNVDQKILTFFPEYKGSIKHVGDRKKRIRIRDLMSMSSGLACNDDNYESPGHEDRMQEQNAQPDWVKFTLDLPMKREPGKKAVYCTGGVNLLGQIVSNVSRKPSYEFLQTYLFEPLGIKKYTMNMTPMGNGYLGGGIHMRPRDLAKFGQLFANKGVWKGKRVISEKWVQQATQGKATMHNASYKNYGYNWWIHRFEVEGEKFRCFYAAGNGGQLIFVVPKLDLVTVINAGNYGQGRLWLKYRDEIMPRYVIPALMKAKR
ncbi:serine hydrolase domain-containing protein [Microscilla marina]|uniref:Putative 6-aminohexanoate-dimer hydrolase n=1 Tax=Microscilla marina ATCC 23134 TaxID=313606 RepID=A1ZRN3_MICM2|nr:serine hydrolase [Microscilla marina]EAY26938.1 putative 6-aminohexanoate-dimer hydrolase [Microscilla marina ATCC 23134]